MQAGAALPFRRILVTGANGFVGKHLVPALAARLADGASMMLASRTPGTEQGRILFDLTDPVSVGRAVDAVRPDLVVHLAAQASVGRSHEMAADTWAINVGGSLALARAIATTVPDCTLLLASSAEVYGLAFNDGRVTETAPLRPQGPYARSKAAVEAMFGDVLPASARLIVVRPSNHSGRGQGRNFALPAFAAQIARIEQGAPPEIRVGNLDAERDFLHVQDVVAAYVALLGIAPGLPGRTIFNVASGRTVRIGDLLDRLRGMSRCMTTVVYDPLRIRPSEVLTAAVDSSAIRAATGWTATHDLDEMLTDVLEDQRARFS